MRSRWTWMTIRVPPYFEQAQNGVYMRMALIMTLLGLADPKTGEVAFDVNG